MTISLDIVPFSQSLDMYGEPDRSTAYSLSGHISVKVSSSPGYFSQHQASRLLLNSLTVVFEGQTEMISHEMGYTGCRLCSVSQELIHGEPVELSHEGSDPSTWNVVFNLAVPGWLPETAVFGENEDEKAGTHYALHATAEFSDLNDGAGPSLLSALCFPFRPSRRTVAAPIFDVPLKRFMCPQAGPSSESSFPSTVTHPIYSLYAQPADPAHGEGTVDRIPMEILTNFRVLASVPQYIDPKDTSFGLSLRIRVADIPGKERKRLRIASFDLEVEQMERYRSSPISSYTSQFPLPPASGQPPRKPLLNPHPLQPVYELGLVGDRSFVRSCTRSLSLLPSDASGHYSISGDGYAFSQEADPSRGNVWYSVQTQVPVAHTMTAESSKGTVTYKLRESCFSPLFAVQHRLHISLLCTYDITEGENPERITERLRFQVPLRFAHVIAGSPSVISRDTTPSPSLSGHSPSMPYAQTLPAYSQLFDPNGDRKIDYSVPLPPYTPPS
ncbi:hypothetical protein BKA93DRAFT_919347, partial [Sparassis latifolia]